MHQSERAFRAHATGPQLKRRAGRTGSCCRGAGHDEGEKDGSKGLPGQNFSKGLLSLFTRHGVHRALPFSLLGSRGVPHDVGCEARMLGHDGPDVVSVFD